MIPLFKTTYSLKSILTLDKPEKVKPDGADSVVEIAVSNNLERVYLLEDTMIGFKKALEIFGAKNIELVFGVRFNMCNNRLDEDKTSSASKIAIFAQNDEGCRELMKLYSAAFTESQGYVDSDLLRKVWSDNLFLALPFYDSFIHRNAFWFQNCIPDLTFTKPTVLLEDNELQFDQILRRKVLQYAKQQNLPTQEAKTIYYKHRNDFTAYQTYRIITGRTGGKQQTLENPNLEDMTSREFCWESFVEKNGQTSQA